MSTHTIHTAEQALERLGSLPGGPELLERATLHDGVALVGGAVRDLLLGHWPRELDVTVSSDAAGLAQELAASVSPSERAYGHAVAPVLHERFGTASVAWEYGRIDIAERRAESYPAPGALPLVRPGTVEEDLARRDFTVNAIALPLAGPERGRLLSVDGAVEDLAAGTLRVLHEQSFRDDPTRLLRLARYAARLGFEIEPRTRELAVAAVAGGALETVSGGRLGSELWLAVKEEDGRAALRALDSLGVTDALGMASPFDDDLAREAEALLPADGSRAVLLMGVAMHPDDDTDVEPADVMERLELSRDQTREVLGASAGADPLAELILRAAEEGVPPSLDLHGPEAVAVAGALAARRAPAAREVVRSWFANHRHVRLEIDGSDLLAAGVPQGPEVGARLLVALRRKREGRSSDREQELHAALEGEFQHDSAIGTGEP